MIRGSIQSCRVSLAHLQTRQASAALGSKPIVALSGHGPTITLPSTEFKQRSKHIHNEAISTSLPDMTIPVVNGAINGSRSLASNATCLQGTDAPDEFIPPEAGDMVSGGIGDMVSQQTVIELPAIAGFTRFRKSCYFDATVRYGVKGFVTYNHMLLPSSFGTVMEEYNNLTNNVCIWDVAAERQIEIHGPDAEKLANMITPRKLTGMKVGDCRYAIITDERGHVLNDPVALKIADDRFWFSIADSDMLLWIKGISLGLGLDVRVSEAEVSPLAVQGPKAHLLLMDLFGEWVDDLKYYKFKQTFLDGIPMLLARSGWSPERGYELYLQDESRGEELWERVYAAGQKYGITPGVPNQIRRIEGGLLSYGADITNEHSVLELPVPKFMIAMDKENYFFGQDAVKAIVAGGGPSRKIVGLQFAEDANPGLVFKRWVARDVGGRQVGNVSSACFSPMLNTTLAVATLDIKTAVEGTSVIVQTGHGPMEAKVRNLPFMKRM